MLLQGLDKFLSPPTRKCITKMLNSCPPTSSVQIGFLKNSWWTHHHIFILSMSFGDIDFGLCPSLIISTVNGQEFIIAYYLISICRDASSKMRPCVCSREFKIALVDLIWQSQIPPMWLVAGGFLFQVIQSPPWSWRKFSIFMWSNLLNTFSNSYSAPTKLEPLSERVYLTFPLQAINFFSAWMNESVSRLCVTSVWTSLLARKVKISP